MYRSHTEVKHGASGLEYQSVCTDYKFMNTNEEKAGEVTQHVHTSIAYQNKFCLKLHFNHHHIIRESSCFSI